MADADGRPGADFLKMIVGKYGDARYSDLSVRFSGKSGGTADFFALSRLTWGVFYLERG